MVKKEQLINSPLLHNTIVKQIHLLDSEMAIIVLEFSCLAIKHMLALSVKNSHTASLPLEYGEPSLY